MQGWLGRSIKIVFIFTKWEGDVVQQDNANTERLHYCVLADD